MPRNWQSILFWAATGAASLGLLLVLVNAHLSAGNQALRADNAQRQALINDTLERRRSSPLIRDLLIAAQKEPNAKIRDLLAKYSIPVPEVQPSAQTPSQTSPQTPAPSQAPAAGSDKPAPSASGTAASGGSPSASSPSGSTTPAPQPKSPSPSEKPK